MRHNLKIGDEIGFVINAQGIDTQDATIFLPVVEVTRIGDETAYRCQFPDGQIRGAIPQSALVGHEIKIKPVSTDGMICLLERVNEFAEAMKRGTNWNLQVYQAWEKDSYYVRNLDNDKEYLVNLKTIDGRTFCDCECPDFIFRNRICKHVAEVLTYSLFRTTGR